MSSDVRPAAAAEAAAASSHYLVWTSLELFLPIWTRYDHVGQDKTRLHQFEQV